MAKLTLFASTDFTLTHRNL